MGQETEAVTAAAVAGDQAASNGAGDIAAFKARREELETRRRADITIADNLREAAIKNAVLYNASGRKGTADRMRTNAERDHQAAVKAATDAFYNRLALFAVDNGYVSLVPADQMGAAAASLVRRQIEPVVTVLQNLEAAKIDTLDLGNGTVWNVAERLASLRDIGLKIEAEKIETVETVETAAA